MKCQDKPIVLTLEDAAEYFGLSVTFLRQRVWEKKIPFMKSGKKYYVLVSGVEQFLINACQSFDEFDSLKNSSCEPYYRGGEK